MVFEDLTCKGWIISTLVLSLMLFLEFIIIYLLIKYGSRKDGSTRRIEDTE